VDRESDHTFVGVRLEMEGRRVSALATGLIRDAETRYTSAGKPYPQAFIAVRPSRTPRPCWSAYPSYAGRRGALLALAKVTRSRSLAAPSSRHGEERRDRHGLSIVV